MASLIVVAPSRRRAIEDVASALFREHGYAATSIRDIARALDLQGPSLYAHVASKEDVLWAIVDRTAARFESAADSVLDGSSTGPASNLAATGLAPGLAASGPASGPVAAGLTAGSAHRADPSVILAELVRAHVRVITDDVGSAGVFVREWRSLSGERRAVVLERRDAYEARFRALIEAGMSTGMFVLTDAGIAATALLSALNGIPGWYDPAGRLTADRIADHFVDLTIRMLHGADR